MHHYNKIELKENIRRWLKEDMPFGDITTSNIVIHGEQAKGDLVAKEAGILCGSEVFELVFDEINKDILIEWQATDGRLLEKGDIIAHISGPMDAILMGERLALNLMQRMSGIATMSKQYADAVDGLPVRVVDTRKTTPGLRSLEKHAVLTGGCYNHRYCLSDAVMIKDNHIAAAGGIAKAVELARKNIAHTVKIEVEVETLEELAAALESKADIIMLDNMSLDTMKEAVAITDGAALLEASGNMTLDRVRSVAETGIDIISVGALTHSVSALDISLKFQKL